MPATDVTRNATAADGSAIPLQFGDLLGDGTRLATAHLVKNADGATVNPATEESLQSLGAALGSDGAAPPALPGGGTGVRGWLRQIATLLGAPLSVSVGNFPATQAIAAGENHLGEVGGRIAAVSAGFSRPADTTAYAAGDLVADAVAAASVTPLALPVARAAGKSCMIRRLRLKVADAAWLGATVRVHLFESAPTTANGDNGAFSCSESGWLGAVDVTFDRQFTGPVVKGIGTPVIGSEISVQPAAGQSDIYALLQVQGAVTPAAASAFTLTAEVHQN